MQPLPSSIEAYLQEAGFSPTELLVLKNLLEHDALTIRQMSAKTGKSAGVLDQAMKKLLQKKIVAKEGINDAPKYVLISLDAVLKLLQEDTRQKRDMLIRRHENFEAFIASLKVDKSRPDMLYFDGDEGIKTAYIKLVEKGKRDMIQYFPVRYTEEEDPLREFRIKIFRERRRRGIFTRIIAHDTPLGRRFQTRDPYEYRQTLLIDESKCPFNYEKIVIGDTVACFNHDDKRACFIEYPELAEMEKVFFERTWEMEKEKLIPFVDLSDSDIILPPLEPVGAPLKTKLLSALREFFLTKKSVAVLVGFVALSACLTFGLQKYTDSLNLLRMKEKVQSIAVTAVAQIDPRDLGALQAEQDWKKPEWAKVVNQLKDIRVRNSDILYVYIFRNFAKDPHKLEFVADSHSLNPYANTDEDSSNNVDVNNDGKIGTEDYLQWPGQPYETPPSEAFDAFAKSTTNKNFVHDMWGNTITGYAPIKDKDGKSIAVMGVDMSAEKLSDLSRKNYNPFIFSLFLFTFLLVARSVFIYQRAFRYWLRFWDAKKVLQIIIITGLVALGISTFAFFFTEHLLKAESISKLKSIAATAAVQFDEDDLKPLRLPRDMKRNEYQRVFTRLNEIKKQNEDIRYAYIMRPTEIKDVWEFVADADSNYNLPFSEDYNMDGKIDFSEENVSPGTRYVSPRPDNLVRALREPVAYDTIEDQWGSFISGMAPLRSENGNIIGIIEVDTYQKDFNTQALLKILPILIVLAATIVVFLVAIVLYTYYLYKHKK